MDVTEFEPEARNLCSSKRVPCCGPSLTSQHSCYMKGRSQSQRYSKGRCLFIQRRNTGLAKNFVWVFHMLVYGKTQMNAWASPMHACVLSCFSHIWLFETLWTVAHQAPLSLGFSRQEYWSGLPFPSSGNLPDPVSYIAGGLFTMWTIREAHKESAETFLGRLRCCIDKREGYEKKTFLFMKRDLSPLSQ